jgi:two-component system chemotaxis response regulator CheY
MDILLVDDSKVMRSIVQRSIRQAGYRSLEFAEADSGRSALERLQECKPKLIVSDWNMPEMTGIELLEHVRANKMDIPFGFITSESSTEIREIALKAGAKFVLPKPFTVDDVQDALAPILGG